MRSPLITLIASLTSIGALSPAYAGTKVTFSHRGKLQNLSTREVSEFTAGQSLELDLDAPVSVEPEGRVPVILLPVSRSAEIQIDTPALPSSRMSGRMPASIAESSSPDVSQLLMDVTEVQQLIRGKKLSEASSKLDSLRARYPRLAFLGFMRASVDLLEGKRDEALRSAEAALKEMPNYVEGKRFVEALKRKSGEKATRVTQ